MKMIRKLLEVKAHNDFTLECEMENGEIFKYDMSYLKNYKGGPIIQPLKEINYFKRVFIDYGCPTWPNGFDIDPALIAMKGELIKKVA